MTLSEIRVALAAREWAVALESLERIIALGTDEAADAKRLMSVCFTEMENLEAALSHGQAAVFAKPLNAAAWYQLGVAHQLLAGPGSDHYLEAHVCFERAYAMWPGSPVTAMGLAASMVTVGQYDMALLLAVAAQKAAPYAPAATAEGGILMMLGRHAEGWKKLEARMDLADGARGPPYTGTLEDLAHKTVVVRAEQGFGDVIQFMRYIPSLRVFCRNVIFEVHGSMEALCAAFTGVRTVTSPHLFADDAVPINVMSLPLLLGPAIGWEPLPPLAIPGQFIKARSGIGVCPASVACDVRVKSVYADSVNRRKVPPFDMIMDLAKQFGPFRSLMHADLETADWFETATIIAGLELVISVDTATAHLAASLGIETWVLQRFDHCWRWDGWYPNARIFKQAAPGDWESVFRQVRQALEERNMLSDR